ncbi:tetranectin-like protein [Branchiostoma lanceolatum]|uniref:tetranectin-like protein n=1 Tax=Branchiostoma lanceolatum TaxID=7740 RepID=UPI0034547B33
MSTTVDALKRDQDDMSTTVDDLKRDKDDMSTTVDALKRDQDDMSTTVDDLKRDLDKERSRTTASEQRLHQMSVMLRYTMWHEICYKAFNIQKTFSGAAAACSVDGGTLAMPRDAETDAFVISLYRSVCDNCAFWFGLRKDGTFKWVDGSALGTYNAWYPGSALGTYNYADNQDCVIYDSSRDQWKNKWNDYYCNSVQRFICQAAPGRQ